MIDLKLDYRGPEPTVVEYSPEVLGGIRAHVTEGFESLARGGVETAGVLFGTRSGGRITVREMRPATCSYPQAPAFVLGAADQAAFGRTLSMHLKDPALAGMQPVGWFLSHTRDTLTLRPTDRELFDRYFPESWQFTLVIGPARAGSLPAATIGRSDAGTDTVSEFAIPQVWNAPARVRDDAAVLAGPLPEPGVASTAVARTPERASDLLPRRVSALVAREPAPAAPRGLRRILKSPQSRGIAAGAALWALGAAGTAGYLRARAPSAVEFVAYPLDGVLHIEWDPESRPVTDAATAKLLIDDGDHASVHVLSRQELKRGLWAILYKNADYTAKLTLYDGSGRAHEEMVRLIGKPQDQPAPKPAPPAAGPQTSGESDRRVVTKLENEKMNLRQQLDREREKTADLESRVKVLHSIIESRDNR